MDLNFGPEYERFRGEVAEFLRENWESGGSVDTNYFRRLATEKGYLYRGIPEKFGGSEQPTDLLKAQIIAEQFSKHRAPREISGVGTQMLVPTLLECGEEWQKEKFVRATIEGEIRWCQGYSEPGSGSDLASLSTKAVLAGDEWLINGQKIWTSHAKSADYMFALVRSEPDAPKHQGLSYLLLEVNQPGIEIRPLKQITGASEFNEVFFTDAKTPASWIVGARGEGWKVSRSLLKHERNMLGGTDRAEALYSSLLRLARKVQRDGKPAIEDVLVRDRLASIYGYYESLKCSNLIQLTSELKGTSSGRLQLMNKLSQSEFAKSVSMLAVELIGSEAMLAPFGQDEFRLAKWMNQYCGSLGTSIAGGTSNIQRNIIAERGLGLPRDKVATWEKS